MKLIPVSGGTEAASVWTVLANSCGVCVKKEEEALKSFCLLNVSSLFLLCWGSCVSLFIYRVDGT